MLYLEHSAILLTCIKRLLAMVVKNKLIFGLFESGRFTQVYCNTNQMVHEIHLSAAKAHASLSKLTVSPEPSLLAHMTIEQNESSDQNLELLLNQIATCSGPILSWRLIMK